MKDASVINLNLSKRLGDGKEPVAYCCTLDIRRIYNVLAMARR